MSPLLHVPVGALPRVLQGLNDSGCHLPSPCPVPGSERNPGRHLTHPSRSVKAPPFSDLETEMQNGVERLRSQHEPAKSWDPNPDRITPNCKSLTGRPEAPDPCTYPGKQALSHSGSVV